jgi:hypothetical protein
VLVGRDAEIGRVGAVLDAVRGGRAAHLLVTGEAGIGKSALLAAAVDAAGDMLVLRARGIETDGAISGAVLSEILGSPARLRPELEGVWVTVPDRLRRALVAARDLHPFAGDRFAVVAAWAALLATASETQPVLVVVDDAQWCDVASLEAILFAARRLHDVPVCTLLAVREPPEPSEAFDGLDRLVLRRLDLAASRVLATRGGEVSAEVVEAAAGNPLALVEFGREPASGTHDVAGRLFGSRVASLTPEGRRALLGAALAGPVGVDVLGTQRSPHGWPCTSPRLHLTALRRVRAPGGSSRRTPASPARATCRAWAPGARRSVPCSPSAPGPRVASWARSNSPQVDTASLAAWAAAEVPVFAGSKAGHSARSAWPGAWPAVSR